MLMSSYQSVLDEAGCCILVESHRALLGFRLQRLDLRKVLFHSGYFPENGVFFRIHSMQAQISCGILVSKLISSKEGTEAYRR